MSESPPPIPTEPLATGRFARRAATFSILAPFAAFLMDVLVHLFHPHIRGLRLANIVINSLLIFSGLIFGIIALAATKRHGRKGIFGKALIGTCVNGLLVVLVPFASAVFLFWLSGMATGHRFPTTPQGKLDEATKDLAAATTDENRFYALGSAAKESFNVGKIEDARKYATELLALAPSFQRNWNYGNAIQNGNLVLGRVAVREGRMEEAKRYLLEAGKSPGSPQMDSFGPNMSLAKDLLEKGEHDSVLRYFELCRKFWTMDYGKLNEWSQAVKAGQIPDFGANLVY
jgi:hypothetical protein